MTDQEYIPMDEEPKQESFSFENHPFTKILDCLTAPDPSIIDRLGKNNYNEAKKFGFAL